MKPAPFAYDAPTSVDDAVRLLQAEDVKVLAGGQSLIPILSLRLGHFERLVDLRRIDELKTITEANGAVRIGAMVTQADAERSDSVLRGVPLIPKALANVGHFQIRNRGTVGGSIAHADPAAEMPAVALALDATMEIAGPAGRRSVAAADFFVSSYTTAIGDDEMLSAVTFPTWATTAGFGVAEVARRHGDFALVGAVAGVQVDAGVITRIAVALFGAGSTPVRATPLEQLLVGRPVSEITEAEFAAAGAAAMEATDPPGDVHASAAYRRHVGAHIVVRAVADALKEANHG